MEWIQKYFIQWESSLCIVLASHATEIFPTGHDWKLVL